MGKSSRRKRNVEFRQEPEPAPLSAPGPKVYTFTPFRLFTGSLLLLGVGFAAGVLVQASVAPAPSASRSANAPSVAPASPTSPVQLPSFDDLQAVEQLQEHLQHEPDDIATRTRLAHTLFDMGNYRQAIEHYQFILEAQPTNADVRTDLGIAYRRTERSDLAAAAFRRAIQDAPAHRNAHYNLGIVLAHDLHDPAGAVAAWERFLELAPDAPKSADVRRFVQDLKSRL